LDNSVPHSGQVSCTDDTDTILAQSQGKSYEKLTFVAWVILAVHARNGHRGKKGKEAWQLRTKLQQQSRRTPATGAALDIVKP
jgi:hypothetical protein